jgi:soluble lytic murein transglycosylase-like protein
MRGWWQMLALVAVAGCSLGRASGPRDASLDEPPIRRPVVQSLACIDHPTVAAWERRMRSHLPTRKDTRQGLARGARWLPEMRQILVDNGLPPSLALLPLVESGFYADARGHLDEVGLWQLRVETARRFGLRVGGGHDDRLDPERSTRAAARYLRYLHGRYGEWPLALAAYNAGERRIDRELDRRPDASFWELAATRRLPRTSREYVPHFLAVVRVAEWGERCRPPATTLARAEIALAP